MEIREEQGRDKTKGIKAFLADPDILGGLISAVCALILIVMCVLLILNDPIENPISFSAAALELLLFITLGARFMPCWIRAWSGKAVKRDYADQRGWKVFAIIFVIALASRLLVYMAAWGIQIVQSESLKSLPDAIQYWRHGDASHYLYLAENWYSTDMASSDALRLVFFPLYPLLVRGLGFIIGDYFVSGLIISVLSFSLAAYLLFRLASLDMSAGGAFRVLKYLCILPAAIWFNSPMTESLFLLLSVGCFYAMRKKRYLIACLIAMLASASRVVGVVLMVPLIFEMVIDLVTAKKSGERIALKTLEFVGELLIVPLGFVSYLVLNQVISGSPLTFLTIQSEHWGQHISFFINTVRYQCDYLLRYLADNDIEHAVGLWIPNIIAIFGSLGIMAISAKRLRPSYVAYFIAYFILSTGTSWLLSAPRYLVVCFPIALALADQSRKKAVDVIWTIVCAAGLIVYLIAFLSDWQVF